MEDNNITDDDYGSDNGNNNDKEKQLRQLG